METTRLAIKLACDLLDGAMEEVRELRGIGIVGGNYSSLKGEIVMRLDTAITEFLIPHMRVALSRANQATTIGHYEMRSGEVVFTRKESREVSIMELIRIHEAERK